MTDRPGELIEVEWIDSTGRSDWHDPADARLLLSKMHCRSVGYLVADEKDGIIISQGVGAYGGWLSSMAIPRAAVLKMVKLRADE